MERKEIIQTFEEVVVKKEKEIEKTEKMFTNPIVREFLGEEKRRTAIMRQALELLKGEEAKEQRKKWYCLKLKPIIRDMFNIKNDESYLNLKCGNKHYIHTNSDTPLYQTHFTESEIAEMKLPDGVTLEMFDKVEVE